MSPLKTVVIAGMAVRAILLAMSWPVRAPEQASGRIRIIAGRPGSAAVPIPDPADDGAPHPSDATALETLFADQVRAPVWATQTAMRGWIPAGGMIGCSAVMCRMEISLDRMPEGATSDKRTATLRTNWPKPITYNRYIAIDGGSGGASTIHAPIWWEQPVSYCTERIQNPDRVFSILIRANRGGRVLSKSDLLMAVIKYNLGLNLCLRRDSLP